MRRRLAIGLAAVLLAVVAVIGWDLLQLGRKVPQAATPEQRATAILIEKQARRLTLLRNDAVLASYEVSLGASPVGPKQQEGDGRTPEGRYAIDFKHPRSRFHLALRVSYPSEADRRSAKQRGVAPGSDIMIHGLPNGLGWLGGLTLLRDWTDGCIAVPNTQIEEIWARVDVGTPVEIRP
jgi:murein L,D-transpeptidase YafK